MAVDWTTFEAVRGPVPLYRQVAAFIVQAVTDGKLKSGDGLPGEHALAEFMGVSPDTIRSAFAVLREQGVIVTSTGIGSFVALLPLLQDRNPYLMIGQSRV